jgi:predicted glycoside hydrolase/deacetylase ChbG (UPF0249 family)
MKKLIVNADDLGADGGRNAGILEAVEAGAAKSVSLLANGPATAQAMADIRSGKYAGVSIGLHLNLSEGKPVCPDLRLLTGNDGCFPGKGAAQTLLRREDAAELEEEVLREVEAQIGLLLAAKIPIIHIDGHQHLHVFPAVRKSALAAARKYGIPWVRIPYETPGASEEEGVTENLKAEAGLFSAFGAEAAPLWAAAGRRSADRFLGLYLKGRLTAPLLEKYIEGLAEGVTELMVHPGRVLREAAGPFSGFSTRDREQELEALLSPSFRRAVFRSGVRLISFAEALP